MKSLSRKKLAQQLGRTKVNGPANKSRLNNEAIRQMESLRNQYLKATANTRVLVGKVKEVCQQAVRYIAEGGEHNQAVSEKLDEVLTLARPVMETIEEVDAAAHEFVNCTFYQITSEKATYFTEEGKVWINQWLDIFDVFNTQIEPKVEEILQQFFLKEEGEENE